MANSLSKLRGFKYELEIGVRWHKSGNILIKSGLLRFFAFQIGKAGIMFKIERIPPKLGKLACMLFLNMEGGWGV